MSGLTSTYSGFLNPSTLFRSPPMRATAWVTPYSTDEPKTHQGLIETGHGFGRLAVSKEAVWVTSAASRTLARIDRRSGEVSNLIELRREPIAVAADRDAVWVICTNGWLWRFAPDGSGEGVARVGRRARELACERDTTWVLHANGRLDGVDQPTGEVAFEGKVPRGGRELMTVDGMLIALSGSTATRVAPDSGKVEAKAKLPARGLRAAELDGTLWIACIKTFDSRWGALVPVDLASMTVGKPRDLPSAPRALTAGDGYLWVACGRRGDKGCGIFRVDPGDDRIAQWDQSDWTIYDLAVAGGQLMAATGIALAGPAAGGAAGAGGGGGGGSCGNGGGGGGGGGNC